MKQNPVVHIAITLDASTSMRPHEDTVVEVFEQLVQSIARRSEELNQQTLVSVYQFSERFDNLVWETDVYRLPSIKGLYRPYGWTALIDAAIKTDQDMDLIPQKYGQHLILEYVVTDGFENRSVNRPMTLQNKINAMSSNRTVAILVPDDAGARSAQLYGFPKDNIAVWDATTAEGVKQAGATIIAATNSYMTQASRGGFTGTKSLFSTGADAVNAQTIQAAGLTPLDTSKYVIIPVGSEDCLILPFVEKNGLTFQVGRGYYELTGKKVIIQGNKKVAILEKSTHKVYTGDAARGLLGLTGTNVSVAADKNDQYTIFVQSTANNRKLLKGTKFLYML
jgi:hypothetical protein